jgi:hypothetical protein
MYAGHNVARAHGRALRAAAPYTFGPLQSLPEAHVLGEHRLRRSGHGASPLAWPSAKRFARAFQGAVSLRAGGPGAVAGRQGPPAGLPLSVEAGEWRRRGARGEAGRRGRARADRRAPAAAVRDLCTSPRARAPSRASWVRARPWTVSPSSPRGRDAGPSASPVAARPRWAACRCADRAHRARCRRDGRAGGGRAAAALRRHMQIIFQGPYAWRNPRMSVADIVGEGCGCTARAWSPRAGRPGARAAARVRLDPGYADRYPHEFSGGQRHISASHAPLASPSYRLRRGVSALTSRSRRRW